MYMLTCYSFPVYTFVEVILSLSLFAVMEWSIIIMKNIIDISQSVIIEDNCMIKRLVYGKDRVHEPCGHECPGGSHGEGSAK